MEAFLSNTSDEIATQKHVVGIAKDGFDLISWETRCCDECYLGPFDADIYLPYDELVKLMLLSMGLPEDY